MESLGLACIAFIPDGNRRWAQELGLPVLEGHRRSLINGRDVIKAAFTEATHVVVWGASESNLTERSPEEVAHLFSMLKIELKERLRRTDKVRFRLRGAWERFNKDLHIPALVEKVEQHTASYTDHQLTVMFGYDGETDNEQAVQKLFDAGTRPTKELIRSAMWDAHLPYADMIVRTAVIDDPHDSDAFLPWKRKNAQLFNHRCFAPDYSAQQVMADIAEFKRRRRAKGK